MRKILSSACAVLAIASSPPFARPRDATPDAVYARFIDELKLQSTPESVACGVVPLKASAEPALVCAETAASKGQAFWFARQMQGVDSAMWAGLASDGRGHVHRLYFDSDATGGGIPPKPTLDEYSCPQSDRLALDVRAVKAPFELEDCQPIGLPPPPVSTSR